MDIIPLKINETYKAKNISLPVTQRTKNVPYHLEYNWNFEKNTLLKLEHWKLQKFIDSERRKEKIKGIAEQLDQIKEKEKLSEDKKDGDKTEGSESLKVNSNVSSSSNLPTDSKVIVKDALHKNTLPSNACVKSNQISQCSYDLSIKHTNLNQKHKGTGLQENQYSQLVQPAVKDKGASNNVRTQTQIASNSFSTNCETGNPIKKYPSNKNHTPSNSIEKSNRPITVESIKFDSNLKERLYSYKNEGNIAVVDFSEFDTVVSDPFENLQLDTINEAEELSNVLDPKMRHSVTRPKTLKIANIK